MLGTNHDEPLHSVSSCGRRPEAPNASTTVKTREWRLPCRSLAQSPASRKCGLAACVFDRIGLCVSSGVSYTPSVAAHTYVLMSRTWEHSYSDNYGIIAPFLSCMLQAGLTYSTRLPPVNWTTKQVESHVKNHPPFRQITCSVPLPSETPHSFNSKASPSPKHLKHKA